MLLRNVLNAVLATSSLFATFAQAQSTAFTYQGELNTAGSLANGLHDLRLRLYDAPSGGTQIGSTQCLDNVSVTNGRFTTTVDFGPQFIATSARYLEIEVRPDTGLNCSNIGGFTVLSPRQSLTPAPRATAATTANSLSLPNGSSVLVNLTNSGNVGIGTDAPTSQLHLNDVQDAFKISASQPFMTLTDTGTAGNPRVQLQNSQGNYFVVSESFLNGSNTGGFTMVDSQGRFAVGTFNPVGPFEVWSGNQSYFRIDALNGDMHINGGLDGFGGIHNDGPASGGTGIFSSHGAIFHVANTGNVGIGTTTPSAKLDVNGSIRFSPSYRVLSIPGVAFVPDNINANLGSSGGIGNYSEAGVEGYFGNFYAPVMLPDGATVTRIDLTYVDSSNADFTLSLGRTSVTTGATSLISSQVSSGNSSAVRVQGVDTGGIGTSNNVYAYWLKANLRSVGGSLHKIVAVRITYTITQP